MLTKVQEAYDILLDAYDGKYENMEESDEERYCNLLEAVEEAIEYLGEILDSPEDDDLYSPEDDDTCPYHAIALAPNGMDIEDRSDYDSLNEAIEFAKRRGWDLVEDRFGNTLWERDD